MSLVIHLMHLWRLRDVYVCMLSVAKRHYKLKYFSITAQMSQSYVNLMKRIYVDGSRIAIFAINLPLY